ncbi:hypothetical protein SAMN05216343_104102 [Oscillibacter sp. PC13]|uniref:hypothetical protein n=1 Tax=Oscillibacter sp. PC13 TaxID=1855299 RepID=UPI0008E668DB|nr:hypothetical protein [Oscillibacter sp. PC13]SFP20664.1 hypothetical protein SAMN05216343_104102 [Oscillibacter sp. PC13]
MALGFMNLLKQYKNWDIDRDIIVVDRPPMFSAETAKNYDYPVFCVNSEKGIYYQKKRGEYFDLVLVDRRGSSVVMKNTFVAATNQKGTCCIVRNEKENKNYLLDTRGDLFLLPEASKKAHFFGPGQYGFAFDKKSGTYKIQDYQGIILWNIKTMSDEDVALYQEETRADKSLQINPKFKKFIIQKRFRKQRYLCFTCNSSKQGQIVKWLMGNGLPYSVMPNVFSDDDTLNIMVEVSADTCKNESVLFLLSKYKSTYSIFNVPIDKYLSAINSYEARHDFTLNLPTLKDAELRMCDSVINTMRELLWLRSDEQIYRKVFKPILSLFYVGVNYNSNNSFSYAFALMGNDTFDSVKNPFFNKEELQKYESSLLLKMESEGIKVSKWKSEVEMFVLIGKHYPDSIYQYHSKWLGQQSLDVYVPSLNTGFEYQGRQHFEVVEYFGGEEGLKAAQERDARKKKLCEEQGVALVYWGYDEPVSDMVLKKKLKKVYK